MTFLVQKNIILVVVCAAFAAESFSEITNGSFETGNFDGWSAVDTQSLSFDSLAVRPIDSIPALAFLYQDSPFADGYPVTDGTFSASHGFDGDGGLISISQDVFINDIELSFDWGASLFLLGEGSARLFNVNFRNITDDALLASINIATFAAVFGTQDTGVVLGETVDISAYLGTTINIEFEWVVPDNATGPAASFIDNIAIVPTPSSFTLLCLSGSMIFKRRR